MGFIARLVVILTVPLLIGGAGSAYWFINQLAPLNANFQGNKTFIVVKNGTTVRHLAHELEHKKLIRNTNVFVWYSQLTGLQQKIQSGYYQISPKMPADQILRKITSGKSDPLTYTIPEGYTLEKASENLEQCLLSPPKYRQLALNPDEQLLADHPFLPARVKQEGLEGFLFPDTYQINGSERQLIYSQLRRFKELFLADWQQRPMPFKLDLLQAVTLASVVELEAMEDKELPVIAGVFWKRLLKGWKLESDPTVKYAMRRAGREKPPTILSFEDIKIRSPYNTYLYPGLPPGPIGNPGIGALKAVVHPQSNPYYYFVARGDGTHDFSATFAQHNAAIRRIVANLKGR